MTQGERARCSSQGEELGLDVCDFLQNKSVHFSVCVYTPVITAHCLRFIMHSGFQFFPRVVDIPAQLNCSSASHKRLRFKLQIKKKQVNKFSRPKAKCQAASTQKEITIGRRLF